MQINPNRLLNTQISPPQDLFENTNENTNSVLKNVKYESNYYDYMSLKSS